MADANRYWFPAKRYGWGWGLPATWQGWMVFAAYFLLLFLGAYLFPPKEAIAAFIVYMAVLSAALFAVCYIKGEPPAWRWGDK